MTEIGGLDAKLRARCRRFIDALLSPHTSARGPLGKSYEDYSVITGQTLEEGYERYKRQLEEAVIEGQLQDPVLAKRYGFPRSLALTEAEQMELERFVLDRVKDLFVEFIEEEEVHPLTLGHLLMNSILSGMIWEQERDGSPVPELRDSD